MNRRKRVNFHQNLVSVRGERIRWLWVLMILMTSLNLAAWSRPLSAQVPVTDNQTSFAEVGMRQTKIVGPETFVGTVIEQRKYSIVVSHGRETRQIYLPQQLPIDLILDRPQLDLAQRKLVLEQAFATRSGDGSHRHLFDLPPELMIEIVFAHANEQQRIMQEPIKRLGRYRLFDGKSSQADRPPNDWVTSIEDPVALEKSSGLTIRGRVMTGETDGRITVETPTQSFAAELGNREARLSGFSIADLTPFETIVRSDLTLEDGKWIAQRMAFRRLVDPQSIDQPALPRVLLLGDEVSISYFKALQENTRELCNLHRPAENCRGSENIARLDEWLGPWDQAGRNWDVIVFNCGLADLETDSETYRQNLQQWVERLSATGAKLIWVTTTPLPSGYESRSGAIDKESRIAELNRIANVIVSTTGRASVCDLHELVTEKQTAEFANWWKGKQATFNAKLSQHLAERVQAAVQSALAETR
jgi:acyl-CoA thioesterase-1